MWTRRAFMASTLAALGAPRLTFAAPRTDARFLLVLLRGGLDGLAAVAPVGESEYRSARGSIALSKSETTRLDGTFSLHPGLADLAGLYRSRELAVVHAVGTPGGGRSHFDAQDCLDNGTQAAQGAHSGWLNRAVEALDPGLGPPMALSRQVPLVLRGPASIRAADPLRTFEADAGFLDRVGRLYAADSELAGALKTGLQTRDLLDRYRSGRPAKTTLSGDNGRLIGTLLAADEGPRIGVIEAGGWDTHVRQKNTLTRRLSELSEGVLSVREGLGRAWDRTVVCVVSEFGRTVRGNGTGGTDHGSGGVVLLAGGAVSGGIHGDWPGLSECALHEGRDLAGVNDVRSIFKGVLTHHLGVDPHQVDHQVFPGSSSIRALTTPFRSATSR